MSQQVARRSQPAGLPPATLPGLGATSPPDRIGQLTAIEQSRAAAEVLAAVMVAQQCPRIVATAIAQMQDSCGRKKLAERSFYRYPRGKTDDGKPNVVTGPSVHLARELARCWGNIQYNIGELRRDDAHGQSEMQAWAWDVQTNTRSSLTFIVPHRRDRRRGEGPPELLIDLRDIYENNTNMGARRLREAIFSVLPTWFVQDAIDLCNRTIEKGEGDEPLPRRVAAAVKAFAEMGVTSAQLEERVGRPVDKWLATDLATLSVVRTSIRRGEIRVDEEFPAERVTAAEIQASAAASPSPEASPEASSSPGAPASDPGGKQETPPAAPRPAVETETDTGWPQVTQPPPDGAP